MTYNELEKTTRTLAWPENTEDNWRRTSPGEFRWDSLEKGESRTGITHALSDNEDELNLTARKDSWVFTHSDDITYSTETKDNPELDKILNLFQGRWQEKPLVMAAVKPDGFLHLKLKGKKTIRSLFTTEEAVFSPFVIIEAEKHSYIDWHITLEGDSFFHPLFIVTANENSHINVTVHQNSSESSYVLLHSLLNAGRNSRINWFEAHTGGKTVKSSTDLILNGEGSEAELKGLSLGSRGRHVDINLYQQHKAPFATSRSHYRTITEQGGYNIFQGMIQVDEEARGTNAYLDNKNLLLGQGARADSLPKLRIDNNDVKCSHGSTTGKVDEQQIFYLMTRGFNRQEAKNLLIKGFAEPVLDKAGESIRNSVDSILSVWEEEAEAAV